jgi:hypothetical protein
MQPDAAEPLSPPWIGSNRNVYTAKLSPRYIKHQIDIYQIDNMTLYEELRPWM